MQSISVTPTAGVQAATGYAELIDVDMITAGADMTLTLYDGTSTSGKKTLVTKAASGAIGVEHLTESYTFMHGIFAVLTGANSEAILHLE